ncbi:hypothetical protein K469DRAFT_42358 [Zopfia rhizophila CBS 207.26]|uniref:Uncharacterized protein n=1 Tax=Zopfia rhizophila CBS 207.26 TaxID=1314779 RepID=A0A6A6ECR3_9PEZI|nr:hypothetical protein K469DRAFT_42358 [Zopfia rhizophila CBS 207.26]
MGLPVNRFYEWSRWVVLVIWLHFFVYEIGSMIVITDVVSALLIVTSSPFKQYSTLIRSMPKPASPERIPLQVC